MKNTPNGMNEVVWAERGGEVGVSNGHPEGGPRRSQDDAMVGYFFQRPQTDPDFHSSYPSLKQHSRWALGDDSVLEVRGSENSELESDFQALALETGHPLEYSPAAKKLWGEESKPDDKGNILFGDQWRDAAWSTGHNSATDGGLGVKMVEYVLGSSPTSKDLDNRMARLHLHAMDDKLKKSFDGEMGKGGKEQQEIPNGIMQNGLSDDYHQGGSRQSSPSEEGGKKGEKKHPSPPPSLPQQLDPSAFEGGDPLHFDYAPFMQSIDSPNPMDYNNQLYSRTAQGQPMPVMGQQQFPPMGQGGGNPAASPAPPFASSPYVMNPQDPYAPPPPMGTLMPGPAMMAQYYGVPPWGMFPAGMMPQGGQGQGSQQQLMRSTPARPLTPQGGDMTPQPQMQQPGPPPGGQYQMVAPSYYENGAVMMGNARGMTTPMRLGPPVLVNPAAPNSNPGTLGRLLGSQGGGGAFNTTPSSYASSPSYSGFSSSSQLGYGSAPLGYGSASSMGPIGASLSAIGTSIGAASGSPRRDSFERREGPSLGLEGGARPQKGGQFYGPLGSVSASGPGPVGMMPPSQSLTPPPSLNGGSLGNFNLGTLGGRMLSAAPGAEAKYMIRNGGPLGSSTLFPTRTPLQRSSSLEKPSGRSRLLEDFRNNRYPNLQLRDLSNHIVEFSQDQHGSRFIQQKLERAAPVEKQLVFNEILGAAYSLMTDVFGNYVIQKFFEFGTQEQKQALALKVKGHVLPLALQMYGCRVIQKALESIPPEQQKEIVKELDGHVLKCVKDQNGNHVVQKCIECVDPVALQFIINAFQGQVFSLSTHPYGCRVIQRILEHCTGDQTVGVLEELHQHTEQLVQDQYGNYVVQHVLEHGAQEDKQKIVATVRGKVLPLSQHKFASNVVEKCVTHASRAERAVLIEEVCTYNDGPHSALYSMMKDQYANYVVQRMIEVSEPPQRKLLLHKIRPHVPSLRKYTYGKHILAKLEKYLAKGDVPPNMGAPPQL